MRLKTTLSIIFLIIVIFIVIGMWSSFLNKKETMETKSQEKTDTVTKSSEIDLTNIRPPKEALYNEEIAAGASIGKTPSYRYAFNNFGLPSGNEIWIKRSLASEGQKDYQPNWTVIDRVFIPKKDGEILLSGACWLDNEKNINDSILGIVNQKEFSGKEKIKPLRALKLNLSTEKLEEYPTNHVICENQCFPGGCI